FPQAALGDTIQVSGVDGPVEVTIPPGTQPGQEFRIPGKGLPKLGTRERGDLRVRVNRKVPKNLTQYQQHLIEQLKKSMEGDIKSKKSPKGFLEQFREQLKKDK
ncbi:MAG: DnaJ C-terminal domain-containing protein, partial [Candidatus Caldarchaeum sp.]